MDIPNQHPQSNPNKAQNTLREHVLEAIDAYFNNIKDNGPLGLHTLVIEEVEAAMYEAAMKFTKGNQVQAAKVLGVARGTLRTKLKQYFGTTQVGGLYHKYTVKPLTSTQQQPLVS
ncbi:MAG: hypothetical protein HRT87_01480 [Legionellales bacterium]|nr:hypothetical protein [Legionellales bacterium]